jgi:glycosidase
MRRRRPTLTGRDSARGPLLAALAALCLLSAPAGARASDFRRGVIYQIVTDRFFDGDPSNNDPPQSAGLYDPARADWRLYWGGDLEGIRQKLEYLAGMGVTAVWISPPVDNVNVRTPAGVGRTGAPYHGYHARDFKRIEEHFGDAQNSWDAFDRLVAAAHAAGIKVIVDFAPNHTSFQDAGEYGALYDDGKFLADYRTDPGGLFRREGPIADRYGRYNVQYQTLYDLADINQEHPLMDAYLKDAARLLQRHGADGFRVDGSKHVTWGWQASLANALHNSGESFVYGEWYLEDPQPRGWWQRLRAFLRGLFSSSTPKFASDPLYGDAAKLANRGGLSLLNFPLNAAVRETFGPADAGFAELDALLERQAHDFARRDELVNFVDNHDMRRLLSLGGDPHRLHAALAFILTAPGVPSIYYGTEQYLHDDTEGGGDPYNRPMMNSFSTDTPAYSLISRLSALRRDNPALAYGTLSRRRVDDDVYIYERKFFGNVVLVAINKSGECSYEIDGLRTSLPPASHADHLGGPAIDVAAGEGGENQVAAFRLPARAVAVWSYRETAAGPRVGAVGPALAQTGARVTVFGENFGATAGTVLFGETPAAVASWSDGEIRVLVPAIAGHLQQVRVFDAAGRAANAVPLTLLGGELLPVTFRIRNAPPPQAGEHLFLAGGGFELGDWSAAREHAVGPLVSRGASEWFVCASVPAGQTLQFKLVKVGADGGVAWEAGPNHTYTTPAGGTAEAQFEWQY